MDGLNMIRHWVIHLAHSPEGEQPDLLSIQDTSSPHAIIRDFNHAQAWKTRLKT